MLLEHPRLTHLSVHNSYTIAPRLKMSAGWLYFSLR